MKFITQQNINIPKNSYLTIWPSLSVQFRHLIEKLDDASPTFDFALAQFPLQIVQVPLYGDSFMLNKIDVSPDPTLLLLLNELAWNETFHVFMNA
jgi:hypothetical protein